MWLLSLVFAYPEFQNTRLDNPLAEIKSLFPLYYVAIALFSLSIVTCWVWRIGSRCLHVTLLVLFAAMLWLTPYLLTGFVRLPDGPWHVGMAMNISEVLQGQPVTFSDYAWDYPGSFVFHKVFVDVVGIEPLAYLYIYPAISCIIIVLLGYAILSRLFNPRVAFLSLAIAMPGLHYIQLHASPHTLGALMMLTALLLLAVRGRAPNIIAVVFVLFAVTIVTHPQTPLLISIFLTAAIIVSLIRSRRIDLSWVLLAGILIFCFVGWFVWYAYYPISPWNTANNAPGGVASTITGTVASGGFDVGSEYLTGTRFIYSNIYNLNKAIYFLYAAVCALGILYVAVRAYFHTRGIGRWLSSLCGLKRSEAMLALSVPPLLLLSFLLSEWNHVLIESGLTYIILAFSCIIISIFSRLKWIQRGLGYAFLATAVLFLALSSPIVAYSIDAYSNYPESEKAGLVFLVERGSLQGKTVATSSITQVILYGRPSLVETDLLRLGAGGIGDIDEGGPDIVAFRSTGYYYSAMRNTLSFENNRYDEYLADVQSAGYDKVYSSQTFDVYYNSRPVK